MHRGRWARGIAAAAAIAGAFTYGRYRQEMRSRASELEAIGEVVRTDAGPIEFARRGSGRPALVVHGAGGGFDQGLLIGEDMLGDGFDVIAPSRFGYLGTPLPEDAGLAAQADALATLLDALGVERPLVVGVSAGAADALELALRHPDHLSALILVVPRAYTPGAPVGPEASRLGSAVMRLIFSGADLVFWLAIRLARPAVVRFLGVRPSLERGLPPAERARITALMDSLLPLSRRKDGLLNDASTEIKAMPLERIAVPTLVIAAADDLMGTQRAARFTAEHIDGAELVMFEAGGHLLVGHSREIQAVIASFVARHERAPKQAVA